MVSMKTNDPRVLVPTLLSIPQHIKSKIICDHAGSQETTSNQNTTFFKATYGSSSTSFLNECGPLPSTSSVAQSLAPETKLMLGKAAHDRN